MSKVKVFLLCFFLSSCGLIPDKFDNIEYMYLVNLNLLATDSKGCSHMDATSMLYYSRFLQRYSQGTLNNNTEDIYNQIHSLTKEYYSRKNPSEGYCILKKETIAEITDEAIQTFGKRLK
jgi:hypothetical protein|tara:strand:- start:983 stop:1342 length:360 start_codon:yes stop_codon:yes gene_type:complete